jgi:branched-chain amino acid aminotransferase
MDAFVDGRAVAPAHALIPVTDDGLLRGDGVFEVIRLRHGRPADVADHLRRLAHSAAVLELSLDAEAIAADVRRALEAWGDVDGVMRILVTRGGRRIVLFEALPALPRTVRLAVETHAISPLIAGTKTLSYAAHMVALRLAAARGFDDALLVRADETILEATRSAVFWVLQGALHAPPLELGILESITRLRVTERVPARLVAGRLADLADAQEVFIADSAGGVRPVVEIERVGAFAPGPVAAALADV